LRTAKSEMLGQDLTRRSISASVTEEFEQPRVKLYNLGIVAAIDRTVEEVIRQSKTINLTIDEDATGTSVNAPSSELCPCNHNECKVEQ